METHLRSHKRDHNDNDGMVNKSKCNANGNDKTNNANIMNNCDLKRESDARHNLTMKRINHQIIRDRAQQLKSDLLDSMSSQLEELLDGFVSTVEQIEVGDDPTINSGAHKSKLDDKKVNKGKKNGEIPDKIFVTRSSVLTELFEISHIRTIYHIFVAILIVFSLNTMLYDVLEKGSFNLNFEMIQWAFGKFPKVMAMWVAMQGSTLLIVYPSFYYWAANRTPGNAGVYDFVWIGLVVVYQLAFLIIPLMYLIEHDLPPASSVIITSEQTRFIMKTHSFIRENTARVMYKKKDDDNNQENACPDFSKYLYFLFCPTLVYRDNYPRTQNISWRYVVTNFLQVLACLFYIYYIFERFCVPVFQNFNGDHITPKAFILSVFGCMMPGTLVLFITFFAILHSWLNAFAEMLRFGDRLFYKDWWNSTTFSNYYRTWNVVVHDWLYTYVYKDICKLIGNNNRPGAMACVFLISAVFHEYILTCTFKFFYPVLFVMFAGAGFGFIFLTDKGSNRSWNVFMWVALFIGNGLLMCLYSMEFYARQNCPASAENFLDLAIPRSWFCDLPK